jgi:hypothetical protein
MTPTFTSTHKILDAAAIKFLAGCKGPCITILIPGHHPGAQERPRRTVLSNLVRTAADQIEAGKLARHAGELLAPVQEMAREEEIDAGGPGFGIFRSPEFVAHYAMADYTMQGQPAEKLVIGSHFHLTPFVAGAFAPAEFYILGVSRRHPRLLEYVRGNCRQLKLPSGVPESVEAAGGFDQPDHDLQNRSAVGPSSGDMHGVPFGTLSDREAAGQYLLHYYRLVDQGLRETLAGKPLLLAGVHEEVSAFRRSARYDHILESEITGNVDHLSPAEIAVRGTEAAVAHYYAAGERVLADFREMTERRRTLNDLREVLRAAAAGRVHRLCVRADTQVIGPMEPTLDSARLAGEDLVNASVAETLRAGGEVFVLPADKMTVTQPVAAILRY